MALPSIKQGNGGGSQAELLRKCEHGDCTLCWTHLDLYAIMLYDETPKRKKKEPPNKRNNYKKVWVSRTRA
jgi:hypothetical protein